MPSKKSMDQTLLWLQSKTKDPDILEAINAELCINVIKDLKKQLNEKGYTINALREKVETISALHEEIECPYDDLVPEMRFYAREEN